MADELKNLCLKLLAEGRLLPEQKSGLEKALDSSQPFEQAFRKIPSSDKQSIFGDSNYLQRIVEVTKGALRIIPSAGTTRSTMSFRFEDSAAENARKTEILKQIYSLFGVDSQDTIIVNCYPGGVQVPQGVNLFETYARAEVLEGFWRQIAHCFKNYIFIIQPHFAKYILDSSMIPESARDNCFFALGGEWFPASFCRYVGHHLGLSPEVANNRMVSFYGLAEVAIGIGYQSPEANYARIGGADCAPMEFSFDPNSYYLETIDGELTITSLDPDRIIPVLRYRTGDNAEILPSGLVRLEPRFARRDLKHLVETLYGSPEIYKFYSPRIEVEGERASLHAYRPVGSEDAGRLKKLVQDSGLSIEIGQEADYSSMLNKKLKRYEEAA